MADPAPVSVVIPAYNEASAIGQVVAALLGSSRWREVIVVDDGSIDDTAAAAAGAGALVVRHPYNKGNGAAVKSGVRTAQGAWVLICDGDEMERPSARVTNRGRSSLTDSTGGGKFRRL